MGVRSLKTASIANGVKRSSAWDNLSATSDMTLIQSYTLSSNQSDVTFSSLGSYSSLYKHLRLEASCGDTSVGLGSSMLITINGDTGSNYNAAALYGGGVTPVGSWAYYSVNTPYSGSSSGIANVYSNCVWDIPDAFSTDKWKTIMNQFGVEKGDASNGYFGLNNLQWKNTAAITSININIPSYSLKAGSRFSLYGLKG